MLPHLNMKCQKKKKGQLSVSKQTLTHQFNNSETSLVRPKDLKAKMTFFESVTATCSTGSLYISEDCKTLHAKS